jgi:hypothetical protein
MNAFKRSLMTMRETVRAAFFLASMQVPVVLLAILAAVAVLATVVLVLAPAVVAFRALYGHW